MPPTPLAVNVIFNVEALAGVDVENDLVTVPALAAAIAGVAMTLNIIAITMKSNEMFFNDTLFILCLLYSYIFHEK